MYCFHVWVNLYERPGESQHGAFDSKVEALRALVKEKVVRAGDDCVVGVNFSTVLQFSDAHNRRRDHHEKLLEVLRFVVEHFRGSYGLVYWMDDDPIELSETFGGGADYYRVIAIRDGVISHHLDPFLSPLVAEEYPDSEFE